MSQNDAAGVTDSIEVFVNESGPGPDPDAKGPDPAEWDPEVVAARTNDGYAAEGDVVRRQIVGFEEPDESGNTPPIYEEVMAKGPDPAQWG